MPLNTSIFPVPFFTYFRCKHGGFSNRPFQQLSREAADAGEVILHATCPYFHFDAVLSVPASQQPQAIRPWELNQASGKELYHHHTLVSSPFPSSSLKNPITFCPWAHYPSKFHVKHTEKHVSMEEVDWEYASICSSTNSPFLTLNSSLLI